MDSLIFKQSVKFKSFIFACVHVLPEQPDLGSY